MGGEAHFALSDTGVLAYAAGPTWGMQEQLVWVDRQGRAERISEQRDNFEQVRLSPDGRYLAFETDRLRIDVWTHDLKRGTTTRLTSEALFNTEPVWSADGQWIIYKSDFGSPGAGVPALRLVWRPADGTSSPQFHSTGEMASAVDPTPVVVVPRWRDSGIRRIQSSHTPRYLDPSAQHTESRAVAHRAVRRERACVLARQSLACLRIGRVRTPGGLHSVISQPWRAIADFNQWGPASALGEGQRRTVLSRRTQDDGRGRQNFARVLGQWPRMLFENDRMLNSYDVTADGRRFVMIDTSNNPKPTQIDVIVNWFEELKRKVPVR
jgi:hypothetical protein